MSYATKEQLQELIEHIGDNLYPPQMVQHFDKSNVYSTDERMIGQWIDGKPLYQKTFNCGDLVNAGQLNFTHNISNIKNIWVESGFAITVDGSTIITIPQINPGYLERGVHCSADKTNIYIITGTDRSDFIGYVTVRYTKTTDTALDYTISDGNDYSTDERLIGTWINGEPVYQKCYEYKTAIAVNNSATIAQPSETADKIIVDIGGYCIVNASAYLPLNIASTSTTITTRQNNNGIVLDNHWGAISYVLAVVRYIKTS